MLDRRKTNQAGETPAQLSEHGDKCAPEQGTDYLAPALNASAKAKHNQWASPGVRVTEPLISMNPATVQR